MSAQGNTRTELSIDTGELNWAGKSEVERETLASAIAASRLTNHAHIAASQR